MDFLGIKKELPILCFYTLIDDVSIRAFTLNNKFLSNRIYKLMKISVFITIFLFLISFKNSWAKNAYQKVFGDENIYKDIDENRRYNEVLWISSHNSFTSLFGGWTQIQQWVGIDKQLRNHSVRGLLLDIQ